MLTFVLTMHQDTEILKYGSKHSAEGVPYFIKLISKGENTKKSD